MVTFDGHYLGCTDMLCGACLPDDESVGTMGLGELHKEYSDRGYTGGRPRTSILKDYLLANADDYRARSAEARADL